MSDTFWYCVTALAIAVVWKLPEYWQCYMASKMPPPESAGCGGNPEEEDWRS